MSSENSRAQTRTHRVLAKQSALAYGLRLEHFTVMDHDALHRLSDKTLLSLFNVASDLEVKLIEKALALESEAFGSGSERGLRLRRGDVDDGASKRIVRVERVQLARKLNRELVHELGLMVRR
jgi:hypothetical protein